MLHESRRPLATIQGVVGLLRCLSGAVPSDAREAISGLPGDALALQVIADLPAPASVRPARWEAAARALGDLVVELLGVGEREGVAES